MSTTTTLPGSGEPLTLEQATALFSVYFPADQVADAVRVAQCESGLDPSAYNPAGYGGLFQHALSAWADRAAAAGWEGADVFDPAANAAVSAWLVARDGWWHWSACF